MQEELSLLQQFLLNSIYYLSLIHISYVLHQPMAVEFTEAVVDERGHAAHEPAGGVAPVSYTHLDVYKRQPDRGTAGPGHPRQRRRRAGASAYRQALIKRGQMIKN